MSNMLEHAPAIPDTAIAFLLDEDNTDQLTDILVDALDEAFRILREELSGYQLN